MLSFDALTARRALIDESADLTALRYHVAVRARPVIDRMPPVPQVKALLSRDGGVCPADGTPLEFDPWSPDEHRCPACGTSYSGSRHHAHWARAQHLWLAERAAHLATVYALTDDDAAGARARELLQSYYDLYFALPNRDNVLGPSHLFFSTYLESIWILDYLAAAFLLRELNVLDDRDIERVDAIANEAATIIAEFNEGLSNRQTWNSAALTAIAAWFGDEELAISSIEGRTGLLGHLADGFGTDGMWFEGENYHLFALRGMLIGLHWAATAGGELLADDRVAAHLGHALMAPADTSLPDFTFPARKDARFGVSLAHPAYLECWEAGLALLGDAAPTALPAWIHGLYRVVPRREQSYDAYLHEAGQTLPDKRTRADLSWWALLTIAPELPEVLAPWRGTSRLLEQQGLAVIRRDATYLSVECGSAGGGHGHPDRLALTLHSGGEAWLIDPGTGAYTTRDLFWYRSTLAHNAPMLDGADQPADATARCVTFEAGDEWAWCSGTWSDVRRSVLLGKRWMIDVVHLDTGRLRTIDLPWHFSGTHEIASAGEWQPATLANEFLSDVAQFTPVSTDPTRLIARAGSSTLNVWFAGDGELLRATGPGLPGSASRREFYIRRAERNAASIVTVIDLAGGVTAVELDGTVINACEGDRRTTVTFTHHEVAVTSGESVEALGGVQPQPLPPVSYLREGKLVTSGRAIWTAAAPALDGSFTGFDRSDPLTLGEEHNYFRSEAPYPGAEDFAAEAYVNWSDDDLFLAVDVIKSGIVTRAPDAPRLDLDNEPEDINADSLQVYWRDADQRNHGSLISLRPDGDIAARAIGSTESPGLAGRWTVTPNGYRVTVRIPCPNLIAFRRTERLPFDLIVNEMREGRVRRSGQLIWSGGPGWVYLRGDRHDPADFGELELVG